MARDNIKEVASTSFKIDASMPPDYWLGTDTNRQQSAMFAYSFSPVRSHDADAWYSDASGSNVTKSFITVIVR
jgi:hypothetical protein